MMRKRIMDAQSANILYTHIYRTPDGFDDIIMKSDGVSLTGLLFINSGNRSNDKLKYAAVSEDGTLPVFQESCRWLDVYFSGRQPDFTPSYRIEKITPFRKEVCGIMLSIPYGKVLTYGEIAGQIAKQHGREKMSARAVGAAVGWNPLCLIIPCHRVIGSNYNLTGYGGGIKNKMALLSLEGHNMDNFALPAKGRGLKQKLG